MAQQQNSNEVKSQDDEDLPSFGIHLGDGANAGSNFHSVNDLKNPWQRMTVLERKSLVFVSCKCKDIVHGFYSADSDDCCSLIVLQFRFEPGDLNRRIKKVHIAVTFSAIDKGDPDPEVIKISPDGNFGVYPTTQHEKVNVAAGAKLGGNVFGMEIGGDLKRDKAVERDVTNMGSVRGAIETEGRNSGLPNSASWTLLENTTDKTGVPLSLQGAILVQREDLSKFQAHFTMVATPDNWTQAQSFFRSNPKDDPVLFNPEKKPTNKLRAYDEETVKNLGKLDIESREFSDITFRSIWKGSVKE